MRVSLIITFFLLISSLWGQNLYENSLPADQQIQQRLKPAFEQIEDNELKIILESTKASSQIISKFINILYGEYKNNIFILASWESSNRVTSVDQKKVKDTSCFVITVSGDADKGGGRLSREVTLFLVDTATSIPTITRPATLYIDDDNYMKGPEIKKEGFVITVTLTSYYFDDSFDEGFNIKTDLSQKTYSVKYTSP